jgi:hypothetical protein
MIFMTVNCATHCIHFVLLLLQEIIISELNTDLTQLLYQAYYLYPSRIALLRHHQLARLEVRSSLIDILVILSSLPSSST